jgi:hypothetical protein
LGLGGHYILSSVALIIAFNKSIIHPWKRIRKNKLIKTAKDLSNKKEEIEKIFLLEWLKTSKTHKEKVKFNILQNTFFLLIFNIHFVDLQSIIHGLNHGYIHGDLTFILIILLSLLLTYLMINKSWSDWRLIITPYIPLCSLLVYYLVNPTSLPLYDGLQMLIPSYDYLHTLNINLNFIPMYNYAILIITKTLPLLILLWLLASLIRKESHLLKGYEKYSEREFEIAYSNFLNLCIGIIGIGYVFNLLWPEFSFFLFFPLLFGLFFIIILSYIFLYITIKDNSIELAYYVNRSRKNKLSFKHMLGDAIKKKIIRDFYTKKQLLRFFLTGITTIVISISMTFFILPTEEPIAFESYSDEFTIRTFMSIDGVNYSYGMTGFLEVNEYVKTKLKVFSNDTIGFYLTSPKGFISNHTFVTGPDNETRTEYTNLQPGRYQLIYYIAEDNDSDNKGTIHMDVARNPKKLFTVGPELGPSILALYLFAVLRPTHLIARKKKIRN